MFQSAISRADANAHRIGIVQEKQTRETTKETPYIFNSALALSYFKSYLNNSHSILPSWDCDLSLIDRCNDHKSLA